MNGKVKTVVDALKVIEKSFKKKDKPKKKTKSKNTLRLPKMEVKFKRNPKHDSKEFNRQFKKQEEGMNKLTVDEFIKNRDKYLKEGTKAQREARKDALDNKIKELRLKVCHIFKLKNRQKSGLEINQFCITLTR